MEAPKRPDTSQTLNSLKRSLDELDNEIQKPKSRLESARKKVAHIAWSVHGQGEKVGNQRKLENKVTEYSQACRVLGTLNKEDVILLVKTGSTAISCLKHLKKRKNKTIPGENLNYVFDALKEKVNSSNIKTIDFFLKHMPTDTDEEKKLFLDIFETRNIERHDTGQTKVNNQEILQKAIKILQSDSSNQDLNSFKIQELEEQKKRQTLKNG